MSEASNKREGGEPEDQKETKWKARIKRYGARSRSEA